jgi:CxxC-x17-CxxC domain-containing protein
MFVEKSLNCRDCGTDFVFPKAEQEFFAAKGLAHEPKRCPNCRVLMRVRRSGKDVANTSEVNCAECGIATRVPFHPKGNKPVYCVMCLGNIKYGTTAVDRDVNVAV